MKKHMEQEREGYPNGGKLVVPVEVSIGMSWSKQVEFKRMVDRKTFTEKCEEIYYDKTG